MPVKKYRSVEELKRRWKGDLTPAERVEDIPRILEALKQAVREALLRHKQAGNPVAVWQDGRVVWIQPKDIPVKWRDLRKN